MNGRGFIDVELTPELAETLRLFCEAAGNVSRDEVLIAALDHYLRAEQHRGGNGGEVVPMNLARAAAASRRRDGEPL